MRNLAVLILTTTIWLFLSCDKSGVESSETIYTKWEVTGFMTIESVTYPKNSNYNPFIEFKADDTYLLKLDMNQCGGSVSLESENGITISAAGCTKMCCDSKYSQKFTEMLLCVKTFSIEGNTLKLNVPDWGWIELEAAK